MYSSSLSFFFLLVCSVVSVSALGTGKWCFAGCELNLNYVDFNDTDPGSKKVRSCKSALRATSLYLCIDEYCVAKGHGEWLQEGNATCQRLADVSLPPYDIIAGYSPEDRARIKRLTAEEALEFPKLGKLVLPDASFFERAYRTLVGLFMYAFPL